jgi:hypothetical protein
MANKLPSWLIVGMCHALLGEIYPEIRAIALAYSEDSGNLLIRYYLDRIPLEIDHESLEIVATNLDAGYGGLINRIDIECVFFNDLLRDIDALDGIVYARREYPFD